MTVVIDKIFATKVTDFDTSISGLKALKSRKGIERCDSGNDQSTARTELCEIRALLPCNTACR